MNQPTDDDGNVEPDDGEDTYSLKVPEPTRRPTPSIPLPLPPTAPEPESGEPKKKRRKKKKKKRPEPSRMDELSDLSEQAEDKKKLERVYELERPTLPDRPFIDGVYDAAWQSQLLVRTIGLAIGFALVALLAWYAQSNDAEGAVVVGLMHAPAIFVGFLTYTLACGLARDVLEQSAAASDRLSVGEKSVGAYVFDLAWFAIIALIAAWIPASLLSFVMGMMVESKVVIGATFGLAFVAFLIPLYPVLLLSSMEGPDITPFSKVILKSLSRDQKHWIQFFLHSTAPVLLVLASFVVPVWFAKGTMTALITSIVFGILGVMSIVIYCRLLGRLAFIISDSAAQAEPAVEDDDE